MRVAFVSTLVVFAATVTGMMDITRRLWISLMFFAGLEIISPAINQKTPQGDTITVKWKAVSLVVFTVESLFEKI